MFKVNEIHGNVIPGRDLEPGVKYVNRMLIKF